MKYALLGVVLAVLVASFVAGCSAKESSVLASQKVTVFKSQSCGCCSVYVQYLQSKGLDVEVVQVQDVSSIKTQYGVPSTMESCHTVKIGDYVVEGHVPLEAMEKLMKEKPGIRGIAMPGMPSGSPGMPGAKQGLFMIYTLNNDGSTAEFMRI